MRMLKVRKKSISLLVVLTFLMTLFPLALPAFAAGTEYDALSVPKYEADTADADLGDILISFDYLTVGTSEAWLSLPSGFDINDIDATTNSANIAVTFPNYDVGDDAVLVKVVCSTAAVEDAKVTIEFNAVDIPAGAEGDVVASFEQISGQFVDGDVTVASITGGDLTVKVVEDEAFGDEGGFVTIRVTESVAGTLGPDDTLDLILPDGYEWDYVDDVDLLFGAVGCDEYCVDYSIDAEEVNIWFDHDTTARTSFEITLKIDVDFDEAEFGDVVAKVRGDYDATPETITVGSFGDYQASIEAEDPDTEIYSGRFDQEVSNITIEEELAGSLVEGRMINLELPENARWTMFDGEEINEYTSTFYITGDDVELEYAGLAGSDDTILRLRVSESSENLDASTIEIEDIQVATEAMVTGDLVVNVTSSAGLADDEITIAKIVSPVSVTAEKQNVIIGKNDQPTGNIVITEYAAEAIKDSVYEDDAYIVIAVDEDIEFAEDPTVEVTEGDLKLGDVEVDENVLFIEVDRDSNEASTIVVSGIMYDVNRTVAEGNLGAEIGGTALVETDDFEYPGYGDNIWEDSDIVAEFVSAICVTPAPGDQVIKAVFTLGSTSFTLNDVAQTMDVAPYAKDGRTYLPMRYVAQALGIPASNILWKNGTATFISGNKVVSVTIGSQIMYINGAAVPIDAAPEIVNGRTMLPIRWIATAFGVDVAWDAATQTVTLE